MLRNFTRKVLSVFLKSELGCEYGFQVQTGYDYIFTVQRFEQGVFLVQKPPKEVC